MHILNANEILITFSSDWKLEMLLMQKIFKFVLFCIHSVHVCVDLPVLQSFYSKFCNPSTVSDTFHSEYIIHLYSIDTKSALLYWGQAPLTENLMVYVQVVPGRPTMLPSCQMAFCQLLYDPWIKFIRIILKKIPIFFFTENLTKCKITRKIKQVAHNLMSWIHSLTCY